MFFPLNIIYITSALTDFDWNDSDKSQLTQRLNYTYIRRSNDVLDVAWTLYVYSIKRVSTGIFFLP